ncbi:mechanosensitive ion channel family protein [Microvirga sp. 2MCAF38]|uniref:mechanosensitive ion channel family protein n=1 Tax=Microvirga sp. 2MCAF38 TaxID=3232989 RepID=UPI003F971248
MEQTLRQASRFLSLIALLVLLFAGQIASAEDAKAGFLTPADTSSPRATFQNFRNSVGEASKLLLDAYKENRSESGFFWSPAVKKKVKRAEALLARAARSLDLSDVPPVNRENRSLEATLILKEILDRVPEPASETIPGPEAVGSDSSKALKGWNVPETEIRILRIEDGPRAGEYLISKASLQRLEEFYSAIKDQPDVNGSEDFYAFYKQTPGQILPPKWYSLIEGLPEPLRWEVGDQTVWQWIGFGLVLTIAALWLAWAWRRIGRMRPERRAAILFVSIAFPSALALTALAVMYVVDYQLNITGHIQDSFDGIAEGIAFLALVWGIVALSNALALVVERFSHVRTESIDASLARAAIRTFGIAIACGILIYGATHLGLPLAGILAGLGVGGLAIALAAKPTIENFIGGLILYADRPVRVGDICRFGSLEGQVESIGVRSTRIRGLDRTLITVPNSVFVNLNLINLSKRDKMPYDRVLKIASAGDSASIRRTIAQIAAAVANHPKVEPSSVRVRLREGHEEIPKVQVLALIQTADWNEFLAIQQEVDLLLRDDLLGEPVRDDEGEKADVYRLAAEGR